MNTEPLDQPQTRTGFRIAAALMAILMLLAGLPLVGWLALGGHPLYWGWVLVLLFAGLKMVAIAVGRR